MANVGGDKSTDTWFNSSCYSQFSAKVRNETIKRIKSIVFEIIQRFLLDICDMVQLLAETFLKTQLLYWTLCRKLCPLKTKNAVQLWKLLMYIFIKVDMIWRIVPTLTFPHIIRLRPVDSNTRWKRGLKWSTLMTRAKLHSNNKIKPNLRALIQLSIQSRWLCTASCSTTELSFSFTFSNYLEIRDF